MAKDPAFLFYPNDYIGGTMGMTFEEKGAYMELLMMQFNRGHMTTHMIGQTIGQLWVNIEDKFTKDEEGLWYNPRLDEEKSKRQNYSNSRRNNKLGTNQHKKNEEEKGGHMTKHMIGHMENANENINNTKIINNNLQNSNIFRKANIPTFEEVHMKFLQNGGTEEMAKRFFNKHESTEWFLSGSPIRNFSSLIPSYISSWKQNESKKDFKNQMPDPTKVKISLKSITSPNHD
jgi:uncharacterized protein YdaU (DUF1376 family)